MIKTLCTSSKIAELIVDAVVLLHVNALILTVGFVSVRHMPKMGLTGILV